MRNGKFKNVYEMVHSSCHSEQILLILDGDDQLLGTQVLKILNAVYQKGKYYMVYSNHLKKTQIGVYRQGSSKSYPP